MCLTNVQFDFQSYYQFDFSLLKLFGVWIIDYIEKPKWYPLYFFVINILLTFLFNVSQFIHLFTNYDNLRGFAAGGYVIAIAFMSNVKSFYIFKNRYEFGKLSSSLNDTDFQPKNNDQLITIRQVLGFYRTVKLILLTMSTVSVFSSMSSSLFYKKNDLGIPFAAWFPFDASTPYIHVSVYIYQCISVFFVSYINIYVDIIMAGFATFIALQCDLLCHDLRSLGDHDEEILKKSVKQHWKILRFVETTEKLFSEIYFAQFVASTLAFCMTLFLLTLVDRNTFEFFYLVVYQMSMFSLLLIPCWFASEMTRKSENIAIAAYECSWPDGSSSFKKDILFFMLRTQKPMKLYAIGFFHISVETFVKIFRSSLSYFAVLNNINSA